MVLLDLEAGFWGLRRQLEALVGMRLTDAVLQQAGANGGASFARAFAGEDLAGDGMRALRDCIAAYEAAGFGHFEIDEVEWPLGRVSIRARDAFEAWISLHHREQHLAARCAYTAGVLVGFVNVLTGRRDVVCIERTCQAQGASDCLFELLPASAANGAPVVAMDPDPGLGKQLGLLEMLFDRMPMGIAIFDREFRIRRYNPTWADYAELYASPSELPVEPGDYYFDLIPGTEATVLPLFERVLAGETLRFEAMPLESRGITSYWDVVLAPTVEGAGVTGILNVTIDATDRVEAHQELERTVATLQEREERLALVMAGINDGVWDWHVDTGEVYFSPRWKSMLGYADDEIANHFESWQALIHPADRAEAEETIRRHLAGDTPIYQLEHRLRHKNGEYRWILARGKAVRREDGHVYRLVGSHTDIDERKLAEERLEESQRRLSTLISNLPGMAYRCRNDQDWTMEFVSEGSVSLTGHKASDLVGNQCLAFGDLIHPDDRETVWVTVQAAVQDHRPFQLSYRLVTPDGEKWVWEQGQGVYDPHGDLIAVEGFISDITERVEAQRYLEQRVDERTHELSTLLEVTHNINSTLELDSLLELVLDQLKTVVDYTGASILTLDDDHLAVRAYRGPIPQQEVLALRFALDDVPANREVIRRGTPVPIPDVRATTHLARLFQRGAGDTLDTTFGYVRSWLGVPLTVKDQAIGMLTLDHTREGFFTDQQAHLVAAFANQVAVAIENARLYYAEQEQFEESERRRRVAEGLRDILDVLNSDRSPAEVLDFIVAQSRELLGAEATLIRQVDLKTETVTSVASSQLHPDFEVGRTTRLYYSQRDRMLLARQPVIRPDLEAEGSLGGMEEKLVDEVVRAWLTAERKHYRSLLTVPVFREEEVYGSLRFYFGKPRAFSEEDVQLAMTLGDHAALAIENARLRTQAQEAAVAAERNRLARDLHDAVTQTLFSSSLIAEVLPRIWQKDRQEGERRLAELRELTRGALAEMRTLLLELRPSALVEAKVSDLMRQLTQSVIGRARVPIELEVEGECDLEPEIKIAFYRIAQEALNNVAKHSRASHAWVRLQCGSGSAELYVCDDGVGFDPDKIGIDSLGLGIMRERAEAIGAALELNSQPGEGTEVCVRWPRDGGRQP